MTLSDSNEMKDERLKPLDDSICGSTARNKKHVDEWRRRGLEKISRGEVGVLLLAGKTDSVIHVHTCACTCTRTCVHV